MFFCDIKIKLFICALLLLRILQIIFQIPKADTLTMYALSTYIYIISLVLIPLYPFWNEKAYFLTENTDIVIRSGSPQKVLMQYLGYSAVNALSYAIVLNLPLILYFGVINGITKELFLLLFFTALLFLLFLNASMLYYIATAWTRRSVLGYLCVILYGVWDLIGLEVSPYLRWINLSVYYVLVPSSLKTSGLILSLLVLGSTFVILFAAGSLLSSRLEYLSKDKNNE
jgi:hypothetical protein